MALIDYLNELAANHSKLGDVNSKVSDNIISDEINTELQTWVGLTEESYRGVKTFLSAARPLLTKYQNSPFHDLMAVEFLLSRVAFNPEIEQKLKQFKTELLQKIQKLYYLLEKPHPETAGSRYNERRSVQDAYIEEVMKEGEWNPLVLLALQYYLKNIDEDTYEDTQLHLSKEMRSTRDTRTARVQQKLSSFSEDAKTISSCITALATIEFYRVAAAHAISATTIDEKKHAKKNRRFATELKSMLSGDIEARHEETVLSLESLEGSSHLLASSAAEATIDTLPIQTVHASGMVFHFSQSLSESSIGLLTELATFQPGSQKVASSHEFLEMADEECDKFPPKVSGHPAGKEPPIQINTSVMGSDSVIGSPLPSGINIRYVDSVDSPLSSSVAVAGGGASTPNRNSSDKVFDISEEHYGFGSGRSKPPTTPPHHRSNLYLSTSYSRDSFSVTPQKRPSEQFTKCTNLIDEYYCAKDIDEAQGCLTKLITIVLSLSSPDTGLMVHAPEAKKQLNLWVNTQKDSWIPPALRMNAMYEHLYTLLQGIVVATNTRDCLHNRALAQKATQARTDAAALLTWLHGFQNSALKEVHARMLDKKCLHDKTLLQMLTEKSESGYIWDAVYKRGSDEQNSAIIEMRRHYEVMAADVLQDILGDLLRHPLAMEEKWLLLKAITDYKVIRAHMDANPRSRLPAVSPFYNAILLLAMTSSKVSLEEDAKAKEQVLYNLLYDRFLISALEFPDELLPSLKEEVEAFKLEIESETITTTSQEKAGGSKFSSPAPSVVGSVTSSQLMTNNPSYWNRLMAITGPYTPSDTDIKFILKTFDRQCENTDNDKKSAMWPLLKKAFDAMQASFSKPENRRWESLALTGIFATRQELAPRGFDTFIKYIAPKERFTPYAFALYCFDHAQRLGGSGRCDAGLYTHEYEFIIKNLVALFDAKYALNSMQVLVSDVLINLGDAVTSTDVGSKTSAISTIYARVDREINALNAQDKVTEAEVKPYVKMITGKSEAELNVRGELIDPSNLSARIQGLARKADEQKHHFRSLKKR